MSNRRRVLASAMLAAFSASLVACAGAQTQSNVMNIRASLAGSAEVPPNSSAGTGMAEVRFDRDTNELSWTVTYSGLTGPVIGAHIHGPAAVGGNAPVLIPFSNVGQSPITGKAQLTSTQVTQLMSGLMYVNLHTAAHPGGELRAQLTPPR